MERSAAAQETASIAGSVEAWTGSVRDLAQTIEVVDSSLREDNDEVHYSAEVALQDGIVHRYESLKDFVAEVEGLDAAKLLVLRLEAASSRASVSLTAKPGRPALQVRAASRNEALAVGLRELVLPIAAAGGRIGISPWRFSVVLAAAMLTFSLSAYFHSVESWSANAQDLAITGTYVLGFIVMAVGSLRAYDRSPLKITAAADVPPAPRLVNRLRARVAGSRRIRWTLGVSGTLILAIVANKLSELLPWP